MNSIDWRLALIVGSLFDANYWDYDSESDECQHNGFENYINNYYSQILDAHIKQLTGAIGDEY